MTKTQLTKPANGIVYHYEGQYADTESARKAAIAAINKGASHAYYTRVQVAKEKWYHLRVANPTPRA
jgi:hypothetical protein